MVFTEKSYDRLEHLWRRWGLTQDDAYYAIENGLLRTCVWLPLRYVERGTIKEGKFVFERCESKEGFIAVRPEDFRRICRTGRAKLREFFSLREENCIVRLAYEPPQPAVMVRISDLVVLQADRVQFEQAYNLGLQSDALLIPAKHSAEAQFKCSNDYRHVNLNGNEYHLGDVQARVVEQLHDAARSRQPWVHGKTLIYESGSRALRMRDIFKHKQDWRRLIVSNDRGYYRLNLPLEEFHDQPPEGDIEAQHHKQSEKQFSRQSS
jgi:hypothetical protein